MERIIRILDGVLKDKQYLVGEKCSFVDLAFVTWAQVGKGLLIELERTDVFEEAVQY